MRSDEELRKLTTTAKAYAAREEVVIEDSWRESDGIGVRVHQAPRAYSFTIADPRDMIDAARQMRGRLLADLLSAPDFDAAAFDDGQRAQLHGIAMRLLQFNIAEYDESIAKWLEGDGSDAQRQALADGIRTKLHVRVTVDGDPRPCVNCGERFAECICEEEA